MVAALFSSPAPRKLSMYTVNPSGVVAVLLCRHLRIVSSLSFRRRLTCRFLRVRFACLASRRIIPPLGPLLRRRRLHVVRMCVHACVCRCACMTMHMAADQRRLTCEHPIASRRRRRIASHPSHHVAT
jgi:hypothetical protein